MWVARRGVRWVLRVGGWGRVSGVEGWVVEKGGWWGRMSGRDGWVGSWW